MHRASLPRPLLWASWAGLAWERAWPELWPATAAGAGYAALALLGAVPVASPWTQRAILVSVLFGTVALGWRGLRAIRWPDRAAVIRRLETAGGLPHRALSQLGSGHPAGPDDPLAQAVWDLHRDRLAASVKRLRLPWPRPAAAERDPFALRAGAALAVLVGVVVAGPDAANRLIAGLQFPAGIPSAGSGTTTELWITPPAYTGLPPLYIDGGNPVSGEMAVPAGSKLLVQVHGATSIPILRLDNAQRLLGADDDGDYTLTQWLPPARRLDLQIAGSTLLSLRLRWIPDIPPVVAWTFPPRRTAHGALDLRYRASDDYGVAALTLTMRPVESGAAGTGDDAVSVPITVPSPASRTVTRELFEDFTASPWAGLPVELRLIAHDAIGQRGDSSPIRIILPERVFHHPVAQAIVAQRRALEQDPTKAPAVAEAIAALSARTDTYNNDLRAFLALRVAARQLASDPSAAAHRSASALLWRAAIRIEDGATGQAEADLRSAENALRDALERHASAAEIHQLTQAVREAIARYLQAMLQSGHASTPSSQGQGGSQSVTPAEIDAMLARAEALARVGDHAGAEAVMAQLQRLMESLQFATPQDAAGTDALRQMVDLARKQQQLLDQTVRQQNVAPSAPAPAPGKSGDPAQAQSALKDRLEAVARQMGAIPGAPQLPQLGRAGRAMSAAAKALGAGNTGPAIAAQTQAVAALREAAQALARTLQGQSGSGTGEAGDDPLGRSGDQGRSPEGNDIALPDDPSLNRSRVILDELRRRQGDLERPQLERDYIDRLLQNF